MAPRSARTFALLAAAAGAPGCADRPAPLEPAPAATSPAAIADTASLAVVPASEEMSPWTALAIALTDARQRLLPALGAAGADAPLGAALGGLATGVENADAAALPALLDAASQSLDRYARTADTARLADVDAIRLTLDAARALTPRK